jgi:hypothetical protein
MRRLIDASHSDNTALAEENLVAVKREDIFFR